MTDSPLNRMPQNAPSSSAAARRRSPTSGAAHAKRVEWGKQWAEIDKGIAAKLRRERE